MAFYTKENLIQMGFASVGDNVLLSDKSSYYNCKNIHLGSNIRIDDFCVLSAGDGGIYLEGYNHIACYCSLIGKGKIELKEFAGLSSRVALYSSSDDYSGAALTNPTVPEYYCNVISGDVIIEKHVIIGAGAVVLPKVTIGEGSSVGALSLVTKDCEEWSTYLGVPAKRIKSRRKTLLEKEIELKQWL
jgi:acetyltransferase-like isoleucine patch superfamily enzyme